MKVFLSWSGVKAKLVATAMKAFLQDVNQRTIVWFSASDIAAGDRWVLQLAAELESTDYGIICVTQESMQSPWTLFEAGALAKSVTGGRVCPYLIDVRTGQIPGPFAQFQAKVATKDETWELLQAINFVMDEEALSETRLRRYFEAFWPNLEEALIRANNKFKALPNEIATELLELLPRVLHRVEEIEYYTFLADLPVWEINLNQAAIYVWREVIQVAVSEKKLRKLLDGIAENYPGNIELATLRDRVRIWGQSNEATD